MHNHARSVSFQKGNFSLSCMFMNLSQHLPACANGHTARLKGSQSLGNQVSVDEDRAIRFVWQIFPGKRRLARTIPPRNNEYSFDLHAYPPDPVTTPYCRGCGDAGFYPRYEQRNPCQWEATEPTRDRDIVMTADVAGLSPKDTTQIPIALRRSLTACLPPRFPPLRLVRRLPVVFLCKP